MPPALTRLTTPVRGLSFNDCDPERLVAPSSCIVNGGFSSSASTSGSSGSDSDCELPLEKLAVNLDHQPAGSAIDRSPSTIRLAHVPTGRRWEVSVKDGVVVTKQVSFEETREVEVSGIGELIGSQFEGDDEEEEEEDDVSEDAHLCEAVLRSVFALSVPVRSLEERLEDAEIVKRAFGMNNQSMCRTVVLRAQKAAQYRRAEMQLRYEALQQNELPFLNQEQFEDPEQYASWKQEELEDLSTLVTTLGTLPSFSGFVQVDLMSVENIKPLEVGCVSPMNCNRPPPQIHVYCSVTVLPARSGSGKFVTGYLEKEPTPAFLSEVAVSTGNAEWQAVSPWIPVTRSCIPPAFVTRCLVKTWIDQKQLAIMDRSSLDKVLIEVWDRKDVMHPSSKSSGLRTGKSKLRNFPLIVRRSASKKQKVASWNGDAFLGQVIVSFSHIESQALCQGVMQGKAPLMSYMLADEKGRQTSSTIQLQFACSCERFYRDVPPNKLMLRPPVADTERAFDVLVSVALRCQKEGIFQLGPQWKKIVAGFGTHYRLRKQRCSLGIVMNLARLFQQDLRFLTAIVDEWLPVCESAREGRLTNDELAIHTSIVSLLIKSAIDAIENFQAVFQGNQPPGALSHLLKLLGLVLRWDPNPDEIFIPLRSWIKNSCEKRFYHHLFGDMSSTEQPTKITVQSLTSVVKLVRRDLAELETAFKGTFPETICLPEVAIPTYYKLVAAYVLNAIRAAQVKIFTKDYEDLVAELLAFHSDIELVDQQCELMDLHSIFRDHITQLVAAARTRMIDWVSSSIGSEKWEPLSPQSGALFSFSVVDLYFMIGEVMDEMMTRLTAVPFGKHYFQDVEDAICTAVRTYVEILEKLCHQGLPEETTKDKRGTMSCDKSSSDLCISKTICVKMNNMNAVLEQHQDLEKRLKETQLNRPVHDDENGEQSSIKEEDTARAQEKEAAKLNLFSILERHGSVKDELNPKFKELQQFTQHTLSNVVGSIVEILQGHIALELHGVLQAPENDSESIDQQMQPLTTYLDRHLIVMNDHLHPSIFQQMITEICRALIFCMEEFALNRDEDPNPMTQKQRQKLGESLKFFYGYFYGDGLGLGSEKMDAITARLQKLLLCWDLGTRELCSLYWQAWDRFNDQEEGHTSDSVSSDFLHLLDYLWLLKQRTDDEACEIVDRQNFIANKRMMQFMFGLPKEEELIASYPCRNSQKAHGTLYITSKHICFADTKMTLADSRMLFVIPIDRLMRIELPGRSSIVLIPFHQKPAEFSRFSDRDAVCRTIFNQVTGTGSHLEKSMAPLWSEKAGQSPLEPSNAIKVFKCWKQGMIHKYSGTLLVSAAYILFTQDDKQKIIQMDHTSISRIHAERRGLRPSGVVIELKSGEEFEFCEFQSTDLSNKEIAKQLHKLVFGGGVSK